MNETSPQDKNLEELLKSKPAKSTPQPGDTTYLATQPIDREEIKRKMREEKRNSQSNQEKAYFNKKYAFAGRMTMAITALIFVIVLAISFFHCNNSDCRMGGFELLILAPIFFIFFLAGLITTIVNTVSYNIRKNKFKEQDSEAIQSPHAIHAKKTSSPILKGAGGILALIGVIIMYYTMLVGGSNLIPMLIAVSLFLVAALLVSIGHNKDK